MQIIQSYFLHSRHTLAFSHLEQFSGSSGWYFVSLSYHETFSSLQSQKRNGQDISCHSFFLPLPSFHSSEEGQGLKWPFLFVLFFFLKPLVVSFCYFSCCISVLQELPTRTGHTLRICSQLQLRAVDKTSRELLSALDTGEVVSLF